MYNLSMTSLEGSELSERELDILRLVATGASNKEIAQKLFISPNTVKVHLRNIFAKISVFSRTEAALYAIRTGLVKTGQAVPNPPELEIGQTLSLPISIQEPSILSPSGQAASLAQPSGRANSPSYKWIGLGLVILLLVLVGTGLVLISRPGAQSTQVPAAQTPPTEITPASTSTLPPRWQVLPPLKVARSGLAAITLDRHVYAIGGETGQGVTGSVEAYDPAANTWAERQPKPLPAADIQAVVLGGKIYVPGGRLANGEISRSLEVYDPLQDGWETGPDLPYPVSAYALAAFEGRLYLFGGWDGTKVLNNVLEFDPALETWNERSPLPTARAYCAAATAGGKIYVLGGFDGQQALPINEAYNPNLEGSGALPWASAPPLPEGRYAMGAAGVADTLLVIGGVHSASGPAASYHFFPSQGNWIEVELPSPQSWTYLSAAPLEQLVFAVGGKLDEQVTAQAQSYQAVYTILIPIVR